VVRCPACHAQPTARHSKAGSASLDASGPRQHSTVLANPQLGLSARSANPHGLSFCGLLARSRGPKAPTCPAVQGLVNTPASSARANSHVATHWHSACPRAFGYLGTWPRIPHLPAVSSWLALWRTLCTKNHCAGGAVNQGVLGALAPRWAHWEQLDTQPATHSHAPPLPPSNPPRSSLPPFRVLSLSSPSFFFSQVSYFLAHHLSAPPQSHSRAIASHRASRQHPPPAPPLSSRAHFSDTLRIEN
jgi:hypothetical protein